MQTQSTQTANPPTFESVWAGFQEVKEMQKETARQMEESRLEFDRKMAELRQSQKEQKDEMDLKYGHFTNLYGEIAEYMVAPKLRDKFRELGLDFSRSNPGVYIDDVKNNICLEIDIMLEDGDIALLVEVKAKLTIERINKHIERMEKMRKYADLHNQKRTFLGAVGGFVVTDEVRKYALEQGFYLIEPSGDSFNITPPDGKPKEW